MIITRRGGQTSDATKNVTTGLVFFKHRSLLRCPEENFKLFVIRIDEMEQKTLGPTE
jgi:hypothetical protein